MYIIIFASISLSDPSLLSLEILIKNFNLFDLDNLARLTKQGEKAPAKVADLKFLAPQHWSTKVPNNTHVSGLQPRSAAKPMVVSPP